MCILSCKENISVRATNNADTRKKTFNKKALFRTCIPKINNTFIVNAENLDIDMPMYSLLEYSENCSKESGSLWNYYRDEINDSANENNVVKNYIINNSKTTTSKSFEYKAK